MKLCAVVLSLVTICSMFGISSGRTSKELRVSLPNGSKLLGRHLRSHDGKGIRAFMGIPYAEPPVGDLRFRVSIFNLICTIRAILYRSQSLQTTLKLKRFVSIFIVLVELL